MADLEDALRAEACLNSFICGYRLAQGIQQELPADQPPYNFENEDEQWACELAGRERWMGKRRDNGEGSICKRKDGRWHEVYAEPQRRKNTKDYYLNYISNHIIPELGGSS